MTPDVCIELLTRYHPKYKKYLNYFESISQNNPEKSESVNFSAHPTDKKIKKLSVDEFNRFVTKKQGYEFFLKNSFIVNKKTFDAPPNTEWNAQWHQKVKVSKNKVGLGVYAIKTINKDELIPYVSVRLEKEPRFPTSKENQFPSSFDHYYFDTDLTNKNCYLYTDLTNKNYYFDIGPTNKNYYFTALYMGGLARFINYAPRVDNAPLEETSPSLSAANLQHGFRLINGMLFPVYHAILDIHPGEQLLVTRPGRYLTNLARYFHIIPVAFTRDHQAIDAIKNTMPSLESILWKEIPTSRDWEKLLKDPGTVKQLTENNLKISNISESDLATLQECADLIKEAENSTRILEDHVKICSFIMAHKVLKKIEGISEYGWKKESFKEDIFRSFVQLLCSYERLEKHEQKQNTTGKFFPSVSSKLLEYKKTIDYLNEYLTKYLEDHPNTLDWTPLNNKIQEIQKDEIQKTQLSL